MKRKTLTGAASRPVNSAVISSSARAWTSCCYSENVAMASSFTRTKKTEKLLTSKL